MRRKIMLVDDEGFQLKALQLALQRQFGRDGVDVEAFADPLRALARARAEQFAVVIADYRMPGLNGIGFLKQMRQLQPEAVRVMLTASAETDTAMLAINQAEIFRFIRKPWDMDFRRAVGEALAYHGELVGKREASQADEDTDAALKQALRELEASEPGITRVKWAGDGSVLLQ
jgi:two-component system probable response regulator PhcQ